MEEATKSHRIKKENTRLSFKGILKDNEKNKEIQTTYTTETENSLILLEDVDLIFEEDEGFISAAFQLSSNTKRPIVMTSRNVCSHLSKMAPQQFKIYFQKPIGNRLSTLLELISLAENNHRLSPNYLEVIYQLNLLII